ncbi:MAG: glycosyltransferase [Chromatiales bacterium]|nr:glycosyltransferase [Chromatiales bacterium]
MPRKVLYVADQLRNPHAGTEGQLHQLVAGLDRSRYLPHLLVFKESDHLRHNGFPCDFTVLGESRMRSPRFWIRLERIARGIRAEGYGLAHLFFGDASIACPPVFRLRGLRCIISRRDMGYWHTASNRRVLKITRTCVSHVITNSQAVKRYTCQAEGYRPDQVTVVYNGYRPPDEDIACAASDWPVPDGAAGIVLVANLRPIKRIGDALDALARVSTAGPLPHLVVIGEGDPDELSRRAGDLGLTDRVHLLGPRPRVEAYLQKADIGLLCSESEGFSNALVEYLQAGLPVICTDAGGNPEAVDDGHTGLLYPPGDIDALARRMEQLLTSPDMRHTMGSRARAAAMERFTEVRMVQDHMAIYDSIARTVS